MSEPVTRDEFTMLRDEVKATAARLDALDQHGTRGVGAIAVQMTEVIKDVADVRQELRDHRKEHEDETKARVSGRRWAVTTAVGGLAACATVIGLLIDVLARLH